MNTAGPKLVLIVEDDRFQREILGELLEDENMDLIECASAEAAELVIANCGADLALLVTDVQLAGHGNGIELAAFAQQKFPKLNVVIVSGQDELVVPPSVHFLKKPFGQHELLTASRSLSSS